MNLAASLLGVLFANLAVASLLGLAAWWVGRDGKRSALAHTLWVLVLLKLVTPPLFDLPVLPAAFDATGWSVFSLASTTAEVDGLSALAVLDAPGAPDALPPDDRDRSAQAPGGGALFLSLLLWLPAAALAVWALGALIAFARTLGQRRTLGVLFADAKAPPEGTRRRADELAARLGLAAAPRVDVVGASISPLLWSGAGRARIVLPSALLERLSPVQLDALLLHELAHYARRDHWVRLLELVVGAVYWWLPPVGFARRQLRQVEEQCCDAWVVAARPEAARDYAEALLGTVTFLSQERRGPLSPVATGALSATELTRRLTMIMERHGSARLSPTARLAALVLAVVVLPLTPTAASSVLATPEPEPEPVQVQATGATTASLVVASVESTLAAQAGDGKRGRKAARKTDRKRATKGRKASGKSSRARSGRSASEGRSGARSGSRSGSRSTSARSGGFGRSSRENGKGARKAEQRSSKQDGKSARGAGKARAKSADRDLKRAEREAKRADKALARAEKRAEREATRGGSRARGDSRARSEAGRQGKGVEKDARRSTKKKAKANLRSGDDPERFGKKPGDGRKSKARKGRKNKASGESSTREV